MSLQVSAIEPGSYPPACTLHLKGVPVSIANAIPRSLIRWVKTVSLNPKIRNHFQVIRCPESRTTEQIRVCLEQIAWRIPSDVLQPFDEEAGLTSANSLRFTIRKSHPNPQKDSTWLGIYPTDEIMVLSSDIKWQPYDEAQRSRIEFWYTRHARHHLYFSNSPESKGEVCRPNYEDIILTILRPGESIDMTFYLTLSNTVSVDHYGGSPVTAKTQLHPIPRVLLDEKSPIVDLEEIDQLIKLCPKKVFSKINENTLVVNNEGKDCSHCMRCQEAFPNPSRIQLSDLVDEHNIRIQTRNGIPLVDLIPRALDHLIETCDLYLSTGLF